MRLIPKRFRRQKEEDGSVGSTLAPRDQFDIIVPTPKKDPSTWKRLFTDMDTEVSSLTDDEYHRVQKYANEPFYVTDNDAATSDGSWFACCAGDGAAGKDVNFDANTMVVPSPRNQRGGDKRNYALTPSHSSQECCVCCHPRQEEIELHMSQSPRRLRAFRRPHSDGLQSLFDELSDDDTNATKKRWISGMKRKTSSFWKRRKHEAEHQCYTALGLRI